MSLLVSVSVMESSLEQTIKVGRFVGELTCFCFRHGIVIRANYKGWTFCR